MNKLDKNTVVALTDNHISSITGLTQGQLRAWDRRGFFVPKYVYSDKSQAYSRIYSFKDAVGLRALSVLRNKYKISLKKLEKVAYKLKERGFNHWADVRLYVVKKQVYFQNPISNEIEGIEDGQYAMLEIIEVISEVQNSVQELKRRQPNQIGTVDKNRFVARNSSVISGTRIPTATIKRYFEAGFSKEKIIEEYPSLTIEDVEAALKYEKTLLKIA